jgi:beta-lactamase regulating signal transducer with metallopeptidase domain
MRPLLNLVPTPPAPDTWQAFAAEGTLRATLLMAAAALVGAALWRASASVRHLVWASALAGALAMPWLMLALPSWRVPVLPRARVQAKPAAPDASPISPPGSVARETPSGVGVAGTMIGERTIDPGRPDVEPFVRRAPPEGSVALSWASWLAAAWGVGVVAVLVPTLTGLARLRRIGRRSARSGDGPLVELADHLGGQFRRTRRVVMLRGDDAASPMTWGVLRPVILLPAGAEMWPHERLRAVLLHELAHVKRWDCLTQMLARLACAVYWFHPLVWVAARRLRIESERACDDLVLQAGARPTEYASHLLDVARAFRSARGLAAAAVPMARPLQLEGRLRAILDPSRSRRVVTRRGACLLFAAAAVVLLPLSAARLAARDGNGAAAVKEGERPARSARMTVAGRVLDPDGRPVPGSKVVILGRRKLAALTARSEDQHVVLGRSEADAEGRFRLEVPRTSSVTHYELHVLASRPGFGLGWAEMNRDAEAPTADVRLKPEQLIEGRLVDLQGVPASGVTVRASSIGVAQKDGGRYDGINLSKGPLELLNDVWPGPVVSDAEGRFRLTGIGHGVQVGLKVEGPRFARQYLGVQTDAGDGPKRATLAVQPAMRVSGRVTCADTGAPLADAIVVVGSGRNMFSTSRDEYLTDADGWYDANPSSGTYVRVTVYPPAGSPYLIFERNFEGDDGAVRREIDLEVPRGALLTGRITERGSGRPLAGASVFYENGRSNVVQGKGTIPGWQSAVSSGPDGRYAIAVAPSKGQLLVYGATSDFVHEMKGSREIDNGKPGGQRLYAHAFVPYEVKEGQPPSETDVALTPGATLEGSVTGPEGQTVDRAEIVTTLSISPFHTFWRGDFTVPVRDGHFELHGVAPDRHYRCSFLDVKNGWGTTLDVTAAMAAGGPLTVRLQPCGSAKARLVDEEGRPVSNGTVSLHLVGTPGPGTDFGSDSLTEAERDMLAADEEIYANVDRQNYWNSRKADREGRLTLPALIPGATYRIYEYTRGKSGHAHRWRDFTVEAGRTTDLGDVRVKTDGR